MITWLMLISTMVAADPVPVQIVPPPFEIPAMKSVILTKAGAPAPGEKGFTPVVTIDNYETELKLPSDGPFDLYWQPKVGVAVRVATRLRTKDATNGRIMLVERVGLLRVRGDDLPLPERVILAPVGDPGPSERGHVVIQQIPDYRMDLVAPEGEYSLWVLPRNGARGQRIESKIRVLAGKITNLD